MLTFKEALQIALNNSFTINTETVPLNSSLSRILAQDIHSDIDMPPFDKSAMDGYACLLEDIDSELNVIEIISAGKIPEKIVKKNECSKIMTGAVVPKGANCVFMNEDSMITSKSRVKFTGNISKLRMRNNICYKGEDIKTGDFLIERGTIIEPRHIAVLATVGYNKVEVSKKVKVGIISTGSELVEPSEKINDSKIRNSNGHTLVAQVQKTGMIPNYYGIVKDDKDETTKAIAVAIKENDVILITGGVSEGDYDFVQESLKDNGISILFDKVAIQPGKPITFGVGQNKACFGLPGNPISTFIQFEMMVKPFLFKIMNSNYIPMSIKAALGEKIKRSNTDRESIIPVKLIGEKVYSSEYHGSAHINALLKTTSIISIPIGVESLEEGTIVDVRWI